MAAEKWIYLQFFSPFCQLDRNASFGWIYNDGDRTAFFFLLSVGKPALVTVWRRPEMPIYGRVEPSGAQDSEVNNMKSAWQVIQGIFD